MLSSVTSTWSTVGKYGRHPRRDARHVFSRHIAILPPVETRKATVDIPGDCDLFTRFNIARSNEAEVVVSWARDNDLKLSIWRAAASDVSYRCAFVARVNTDR